VASYYSTPATAAPHIESGKLIPLATTGLARSAFHTERSGLGMLHCGLWNPFRQRLKGVGRAL